MPFDYPTTRVDTSGKVTLHYVTSLGAKGNTLAQEMLECVAGHYSELEALFGFAGKPVNVIVTHISAESDGSGGGYHKRCDFDLGADLYIDATFSNKTVVPRDLAIAQYVAELSESFMGAQNKGWLCTASNGEALARFCAEQATPEGTYDMFATGQTWNQAGCPDWISQRSSDLNDIAIGCGVVYVYWMRSLGYSASTIARAGGNHLSDNYKLLTGKSTAYSDLLTRLQGVKIESDNPFAALPAVGYRCPSVPPQGVG